MENILVCMVVTKGDTADFVYALNTILSQTYGKLEILITGNISSGVCLESLLETFESNKKENIQSFFLNLTKEEHSIEWHRKFAIKYAEKKAEYICFLINGIALYAKDSLMELMNRKGSCDTVVLGNSVFFDKENKYCGEYNNAVALEGKVSKKLIKNYLDQFALDTEMKSAMRVVGGIINVAAFDEQYNIKNNIRIQYFSEIPVLRVQKQELQEQHSINFTTAHFIQECKSILQKRQFTREEKEKIRIIIDTIWKNQSKEWGSTENDLYLAKTLAAFLGINQFKTAFNRKKQLEELVYYDIQTIKVVFFCQEFSTWPSLKPVYEAMCLDSRYVPRLVYVPFHHFNSIERKVDQGNKIYEEQGYPVLNYNEYNLAEDAPDIAIFVKPYSYVPKAYSVEEVEKVVRRCVYIPYGFTLESSIPELVRLRYRLPMQCLAWKVCCDDQYGIELAKEYSYTDGANYVAWGNPRSDFIKTLPLEEDREYIDNIKRRAASRKIILWNTHHSLNADGDSFSSWKKFGEAILEYFYTHSEVFLLWRPHPLFRKALESYMGKEETEQFYEELKNHENILIDEYQSYSAAFSIATAVISDQSSLVKEFMFTNHPIILTVNYVKEIMNHNLRECLYVPESQEELYEMINMLVSGKDPKKEQRENYIGNIDMTGERSASQNILDHLYEDLQDELKKLKLY